MAFSKAKREFYIDQETRKRANMPGPTSYSTDAKWNDRGFKYHDSTTSTIGDLSHINRTVLDRSCDDIDLHKHGYKQSTPLKRNALTSSVRGTRPNSARKTLNMNQTKAARYEDELRLREQKYLALYNDHESLTATVQTLKSIAKEAETELRRKDEMVKTQAAEVKTLKETIAELEAKIKDLQWNMESLEAKCKELSDKDDKSYQQNLNLEEKILGYMNRIESDEKKYNELQKRLQEKAKIVEDTQLEIYSLQQEKIEAEACIKTKTEETKQQYEFQLAEEAAKIQNLNQELAKIQSTVQTVNMDNERLLAEVENYSHEKQEQSRVVSSYQKVNGKLEAKLEAQKKEMARLVTMKTELTARTEETTGELDQIHADLKLTEELLQETQREKQQMAEQIALKETATLAERTEAKERLDNHLKVSLAATEQIKAELTAKTSELDQVNKTFAVKWAESETHTNQLQTTIDSVNANVTSLEEELATLTAEGARAVEHQMQMAKRNDQLAADVETQKAATAAAINEKSDMLDRIKTVEAELALEKANTKGQVEAEAKYEALKNKYEETKNAGAYYQNKSSQQKSTIQKLKQTIVEQTNDTSKFDGVKQQLENERQSVEKLQAKIQSMMGEMSHLRAESSQERLAKNANKKLLCDVEGLEVRLATLTMSEDNWKARFEELNEYVTPFRQDLAKYAEEARHMNGENSKKAKELAELHGQLATNMGHQNQKQKIRYMTKIKQELQETKEQLSGKNCELKKANRQIEALIDDVNAMKGIKRFDPKKAFQKC